MAWLGVLLFGVLSEQIKTRLEVQRAKEGTRDVEGELVTTASGLQYRDLRVGGGEEAVQKGLLLGVKLSARVGDRVVLNGRRLALIFGARPFAGGMCPGVEEAMSTMRAGGIRQVMVPPALGFGADGAFLPDGEVPPGAPLTYEVELIRVSIPPS